MNNVSAESCDERVFENRYQKACQEVRATICAIQRRDPQNSPIQEVSDRDGRVAANNVRARLQRAQQVYALEENCKEWQKYSPSMMPVPLPRRLTGSPTAVPPLRDPIVSRGTAVCKTTVRGLLNKNPDNEVLKVLYRHACLQEGSETSRPAEAQCLDLSQLPITIPDSHLICDVLGKCQHITSLNISGHECFATPSGFAALRGLVEANHNLTALDASGCRIKKAKLQPLLDIVTAHAVRVEKRMLHTMMVQQHLRQSTQMLSERAGTFELVTREDAARRVIVAQQAEQFYPIGPELYASLAALATRLERRDRRQWERDQCHGLYEEERATRQTLHLRIIAKLLAMCESIDAMTRAVWGDIEARAIAELELEMSVDWRHNKAREVERLDLNFVECQKLENEENSSRCRIADDWSVPTVEIETNEAIQRKDTIKRVKAKLAFVMREAKARRIIEIEMSTEFRHDEAYRSSVLLEITQRDDKQRSVFCDNEEAERYALREEEKTNLRQLRDIADCVNNLMVHEQTCAVVDKMRVELIAQRPNITLGRTSSAPELVMLIPDLKKVPIGEGIRLSASIMPSWGKEYEHFRTMEIDNNRRREDILKKRSFVGEKAKLRLHAQLPETIVAKLRKEEILSGLVRLQCVNDGSVVTHPTHCPVPAQFFEVSFASTPTAKITMDDVSQLLSGATFTNPNVNTTHCMTTLPVTLTVSMLFCDILAREEDLAKLAPVEAKLVIDVVCARSYLRRPESHVNKIFNHTMGLTLCRPFSEVCVWDPIPETKLADFSGGVLEVEVLEGFTSHDFLLFLNTGRHGAGSPIAEDLRITSPEGTYFHYTVTGKIRKTNHVNPRIYESHEMMPKYIFNLTSTGGEANAEAVKKHILNRICFSNLSVDPIPGPRNLRLTLKDSAKRISVVEVEVDVEIKDDPTEFIVPYTSVNYHLASTQFIIPQFLDRYGSPPFVAIFQDVIVQDEDTDHFAGGYMIINILEAEPGDALAMHSSERCTFVDSKVRYNGAIIGSVTTLAPSNIRIDITLDGEATVTSMQEVMRCFFFTTTSLVQRDLGIKTVIRFGPSARKERLDGSIIEVTEWMLQEKNFTNEAVKIDVTVKVLPCAVMCRHEYSMVKYVEGTGLRKTSPFEACAECEWLAGARIVVSVVESGDEHDWLSIVSNSLFDIELWDEEVELTADTSEVGTFSSSSREIELPGSHILDDEKCVHTGTRSKAIRALRPDTHFAVITITHPATITIDFVENCALGLVESIFQSIVYGSTRTSTIDRRMQFIKVLHVAVKSAPASSTSSVFVEIVTQPIEIVTEIKLARDKVTWRPALNESHPFLIAPIGTAAMEDRDTFYFDGGFLCVELVPPYLKGDTLFFLSPAAQRIEIGKRCCAKNPEFTESDVFTISGTTMMLASGAVIANVEGVAPSKGVTPPPKGRISGDAGSGLVVASSYGCGRIMGEDTPPDNLENPLERSINRSPLSPKTGMISPKNGMKSPKSPGAKGAKFSQDELDKSGRSDTSGSGRENSGVNVHVSTFLRVSFPSHECPVIPLRIIQYILHCIGFTTISEITGARDITISVGDGKNSVDGAARLALTVRPKLLDLSSAPRCQILASNPPRAVFPSGAVIGLADQEPLSAGSIYCSITENCEGENDSLALTKFEGGPKMEIRNGNVMMGGVFVGYLRAGTCTEILIDIPPTTKGLKQHLNNLIKCIGMKVAVTVSGATKKVTLRMEMGGFPDRYCEISVDVKMV